jgi:hypothetical protein
MAPLKVMAPMGALEGLMARRGDGVHLRASGRMSMMAPAFGIPGSVVFDMEMRGVPLPTGVHAPNDLGANVIISCTNEQARVMESWLSDQADDSADPALYRSCADVIDRTLRLSK